MRAAVLAALVVGCSGRSAVGTATVFVYSNGGPGSELPVPAHPIEGVAVFEEGGDALLTGSDGKVIVPLSDDPATVHVVQNGRLTTIAGVSPDATVRLGGGSYSPMAGLIYVTLPDIGATSYRLHGPGVCVSIAQTGMPTVFSVAYRASCGGKFVHLVGEAQTTTGTKIVQQDVMLSPGNSATLGPLVDAFSYEITLANAPMLSSDPAIEVGYVDAAMISQVLMSGLDGPAGGDLVHVHTDAASLYVLQGLERATTIDASPMIPVPTITHVDARHIEWSLPASAAQPNLVSLVVNIASDPPMSWVVYGPGTMTSATFPEIPRGVMITPPAPDASAHGVLDYAREQWPVRTPDELYWWGRAGFEALPIADSQQTF